MNSEQELINSALEHGKWAEILESGVPSLIEEHRDIWAYITEYYSKYDTLPTKTIIKKHFKEFEALSVPAPFQYYVDEAKKNFLSRRIRTNLGKTVELLKENGPTAAMNFIATSTFSLMRETGTLKDTNLSQDYLERVNDYKERYDSDTHILGIPSGIRPIDEIFSGFQPGDFVIVMGWSGNMKSFLGLLFAMNAWKQGYKPLIISLEMNRFQMGYRLDTLLNQGQKFTNDQLTHARELDPVDYEKWAIETFEGSTPFYLVSTEGLDIATQATIEAKVEYYKPDLLLVDYHQLVEDSGRGGTETEKAKNISKAFKRMALKYQIPIIDICAVTMKDGQGDRNPRLDEISWSKQLAYDADLVLSVLYDRDNQLLKVVSEKTRRCAPFAFYLKWDINLGRWAESYEQQTDW